MRDTLRTGAFALVAALAVAAIALSCVTSIGLLAVGRAARSALGEARTALSGVTDQTIEVAVPLRQTLPISAEVPLTQEFVVPIRTTIPISTVARVPVEVPVLGTYWAEVPVEAEVPVDLQLVVPVSQVLSVETTVDIDTMLPVRLDMAGSGLGEVFAGFADALAQMEQSLRWIPSGAE